jgi:hypothetical protein
MTESLNPQITVWYLTAGMTAPAGIEAHVAHYAAEMQKRGMRTEVMSCGPLPRNRHRFLAELDEAGIQVSSLYVLPKAVIRISALMIFPFWGSALLLKGVRPRMWFIMAWISGAIGRLSLNRRLAREQPDIIHVFGRLPGVMWHLLPAEKAIYHEMMTGTNDGTWSDAELAAFKEFVGKCARVFAPGEGVAANLRRDFGITREIVPVFTICPDERRDVGGQRSEVSEQRQEVGGQRTETRGRRTEDRRRRSEVGYRSSEIRMENKWN